MWNVYYEKQCRFFFFCTKINLFFLKLLLDKHLSTFECDVSVDSLKFHWGRSMQLWKKSQRWLLPFKYFIYLKEREKRSWSAQWAPLCWVTLLHMGTQYTSTWMVASPSLGTSPERPPNLQQPEAEVWRGARYQSWFFEMGCRLLTVFLAARPNFYPNMIVLMFSLASLCGNRNYVHNNATFNHGNEKLESGNIIFRPSHIPTIENKKLKAVLFLRIKR